MLQKSDYFILAAAFLALALSLALWVRGDHDAAIFVGIWVASIVSVGNYIRPSKRWNR